MDSYEYDYEYEDYYNGPDLYHYTTLENARKIRTVQNIRSTKATRSKARTDIMLGPGIYLTSQDPNNYTQEDILRGNYGGLYRRMMEEGRADAVFVFTREYINQLLEDGWRLFQCTRPPHRSHIFVLQNLRDQNFDYIISRTWGMNFNSRRELI